MKTKKHPAWRMLVAGCLLIAGGQGFLSNVIGMFLSPISTAQGISMTALSAMFTVGSLAMMVTMPFVGKIMAKFPMKPLLLVTILVQSAAYMLLSRLSHPIAFYVVYALSNAFGAIPCFIVGPMLINNWFVSRRGTMMGIMMCFGNIGAMVASQLGGRIMESFGYQQAILALAAIRMVMMLAAAFMIIPHPSAIRMTAYGAESEPLAPSESAEGPVTGISSAGALKSPAFYCVFIMVFLMISVGCFANYVSPLGSSLGLSPAAASGLIGIFQIGALAGSFLIGVLNDKIGVRNSCTVCFSVVALGAMCIALFSQKTVVVLYICLITYGLGSSAGGIQPAMLTSRLFGQKDYAAIYAKVQIAQSLGGLIAPLIFAALYDMTLSYTVSLLMIVALCAVNILMAFTAFRSANAMWKKEVGVPMP